MSANNVYHEYFLKTSLEFARLQNICSDIAIILFYVFFY